MIRRRKVELEGEATELFPRKRNHPTEQQGSHELESEKRRLRMEREKASAFFYQGNWVRSQFFDKQKKAWPVTLMCTVLDLPRSGSYDWTGDDLSKGVRPNAKWDRRIRESFTERRQRDGASPITEALHDEGISCSESRIAQSMRSLGLKTIQTKKFTVTIDSNHSKPVPPDLMKQDFQTTASNQKLTSAITYVWADNGWLDLSVVVSLYSGAIMWWSMNRRMMQSLVGVVITMPLFRYRSPKATIIHSIQGSQ